MESENKKCTETARVTVAWGGKLLNYCPVHANQIALLGQAIGSTVQAQPLLTLSHECESKEVLTAEEKELNRTFKL